MFEARMQTPGIEIYRYGRLLVLHTIYNDDWFVVEFYTPANAAHYFDELERG